MISDAFGSNRIPFRKDCSCHFSNCDWQFLQRDMIFVALVSLHSCFCYLHFPSTASLCSSPFHPRASPVYPDSSLHFVPELPVSDFPDYLIGLYQIRDHLFNLAHKFCVLIISLLHIKKFLFSDISLSSFLWIMKEKLSLHITKRSEPVLQWSKANFFTFFLTSFLASFFNATRKKLVTLDFCIFLEIK